MLLAESSISWSTSPFNSKSSHPAMMAEEWVLFLKKYFLSVATTRLLLNIYRCWLPMNRKLGSKHKIEKVHTQVRLLSYTSCALFPFFDRDKAYDVRHLIGTYTYKIEYFWKLKISRKIRFWENENMPLMTPNNLNPL